MKDSPKPRILITSALPYINGIKHLGNLTGSMLPSDVYARYMRLRGHEVLHICATDEHGTPAELAADNDGISVHLYCDHMYDKLDHLNQAFELGFDCFGRSSNPENHDLTKHFAKKLQENGYLEQVVQHQVYCPTDQRFLPDRFVEGTCPHCGYSYARGDQCENCTKQLDPTELVNPRSAISSAQDIETRETKHLVLKQSQLREELREFIDSRTEWSKLTISIARKWLEEGEGLQDRSITRDLDWGVEVPTDTFPEMQDKVFYVWFDAPIAYIAATQEWAKAHADADSDWLRWWRTDQGAQDVKYIQFMAKDNVPFHVTSFPATILGSGEPWKQVDLIKSFNWLTFEGQKFSTSKRIGIFMGQALALLPATYWRWWLISNSPEAHDTDFTWEHFQTQTNKDLADNLGNLIHRVSTFAKKRFDSQIPEPSEDTETEIQLQKDFQEYLAEYESQMDSLEFRKATTSLRKIWSLGNEYFQKCKPWETIRENPERAATCIYTSLNLIQVIATLTEPFLPTVTQKINGIFVGNPESHWPDRERSSLKFLKPGGILDLGEVKPIFVKIEDENIQAWKDLLAKDPDYHPGCCLVQADQE